MVAEWAWIEDAPELTKNFLGHMSISNSNTEPKAFDVFLCHNNVDKPEVIKIANELAKHGIKAWLDKNDIEPGGDWQDAIDQQIDAVDAAVIFIGDSGLGPWQKEEIKSFLNQYVTRKCRVIPVFLPSVQVTPKLPNVLKNFHFVDFRQTDPNPLQQLLRGIKGKKTKVSALFENDPNDSAATFTDQSVLRIYPPLTDVPSIEQRSQLFILLNRVKEIWIDGLLKQSLHNEVLISLGKTVMDEMVETPFHRIVELPKHHNQLANDTPIDTVFDAASLLIILGEPGCGKTTTLLQLVQRLIKRAEANPNERIPIVLNLSSWRKGQLLSDWMVDNIHRIYNNIPTKLARNWLDKGYLIPLLDSLDEVKTEHQADCVEAINDYIVQAEPAGLVVCCRLMEYQWLPEHLKVNAAICIEPLNREQIDQYFSITGQEFKSLQIAIKEDAILQELAQSPLMINVMSMAYQSATMENLIDGANSLEARRTQIFDAYVDKMFQRKEILDKVFPREKVFFWLKCLAKQMTEHSQTAFFVDNLQPNWLDSWKQRFAYRSITSLIFGMIVGLIAGMFGVPNIVLDVDGALLIFALIFSTITALSTLSIGLFVRSDSSIKNGIIFGLISALILGRTANWLINLNSIDNLKFEMVLGLIFAVFAGVGIGTLNCIKPVETVSWSWKSFFEKVLSGFLIFGLIGGLLGGLLGGLENILIKDLKAGLILGLFAGLIFGITGGFIDNIREDKASPNQGITLSIKNGIFFFIIFLLIFGLIFGLIGGLIVGLIGGLNRGLGAVIKHYALRLALWLSGKTPFKFIPFLDYCTKLILLKKVGGGYIFIHRMLQEYFAKLGNVDNKPTKV